VSEEDLTHFNTEGRARMVDVTEKSSTQRTAVAQGHVFMLPATLERVQQGKIAKGDVLAVSQVAHYFPQNEYPHPLREEDGTWESHRVFFSLP